MLGVAIFQIAARNVFETGLMWGDDLVRMSVLWITMVGGVIAARERKHISIDILRRFSSDSVRRWIDPTICLVTAAICFTLAYVSVEFVKWDFIDETVGVGGVPAWLFESIIPIGAFLMGLRYVLVAFEKES